MTGSDILKTVDHTLLAATATTDEIGQLAEEAIIYHTAAVCLPPHYVRPVAEKYGQNLTIATVIGFPLGYDTTAAKICAIRQAIADGADEIDMVINLAALKNGEYSFVREEIAALKAVCGEKILKSIVEACYLTEPEKIAVCHLVTDGGADYIKTSTGFGSGGATHADVKLFAANIGPRVKIKAAGGIQTIDDMKQFLAEGASRLGASRAVKLLKDKMAAEV